MKEKVLSYLKEHKGDLSMLAITFILSLAGGLTALASGIGEKGLGGISPFWYLKHKNVSLTANGTVSIPDWNVSMLTIMFTGAHSGDCLHLYIGNTSLHAGSGLRATFNNGTLTSTDTVTQNIYVTMLSAT